VGMNHKKIAEMANKAILYEVTTTPKPGLVDRDNSGAHSDMDYFTFMASSAAISKGFYDIAKLSEEFTGPPKELLNIIRPVGISMEDNMFLATDKVNTHKGIIFSLGLCVASAVQCHKSECLNASEIMTYIKKMMLGISGELKNPTSIEMTNGEQIYRKYGLKGIRGEAEAGYPTVLKSGLDVLKNSYYTLDCKNELFIQVLFSLMSTCEDSNIVSRHNPETLYKVQDMAKKFLDSGGMYQENVYDILRGLDQEFIRDNISPGGSADLLAVTLFLGLIENIIM